MCVREFRFNEWIDYTIILRDATLLTPRSCQFRKDIERLKRFGGLWRRRDYDYSEQTIWNKTNISFILMIQTKFK